MRTKGSVDGADKPGLHIYSADPDPCSPPSPALGEVMRKRHDTALRCHLTCGNSPLR